MESVLPQAAAEKWALGIGPLCADKCMGELPGFLSEVIRAAHAVAQCRVGGKQEVSTIKYMIWVWGFTALGTPSCARLWRSGVWGGMLEV